MALDILEVFWKRDYKAIDRVGWEVYPGCAEGDGAVWFGECSLLAVGLLLLMYCLYQMQSYIC